MSKAKATSATNSFLHALARGDKEAAYEQTQLTWREDNGPDGLYPLLTKPTGEYETSVVSPVIIDVVATLEKGRVRCRVVGEDAPYSPKPKGNWGVNPNSLRFLDG